MSRSDELRKKFAAKGRAAVASAQSDEVTLSIRLDGILEVRKNAAADSSLFISRFYARFLEDAPVDVDGWIEEQISDLFISIRSKPVWVHETSWCFDEEGNPLEFLSQFEDEDGVSYYAFRGSREGVIHGVRGKIRFLKFAAQDRESVIHLDGEVLG